MLKHRLAAGTRERDVRLGQDPGTREQVTAPTRVDGAFVVADLQPGTYDVVVRAPARRIERLERIAVYAGSVSYVGTIVLSTTPDPVRSYAPGDQSEVVLYSESTRLAIGIDFVEPMDRASVQAAFSTDPPTTGVFYWSQYPSVNSQDYTGGRDTDVAPPGYREVGPGSEITTYRNIRSLRYIPRQRDTWVDTTYAVVLSSAARDSAGQAMRFPLQFSFRTIQSGTSLTTIETQPEDGARNVSLGRIQQPCVGIWIQSISISGASGQVTSL